MIRRVINNYLLRHRNRANQLLHLIGVPLTFVVSAVFLLQHAWWWAVGAFVAGYVVQFLGHSIEGNDAGELIVVKKLLGKPYTEFAPEPNQSKCSD